MLKLPDVCDIIINKCIVSSMEKKTTFYFSTVPNRLLTFTGEKKLMQYFYFYKSIFFKYKYQYLYLSTKCEYFFHTSGRSSRGASCGHVEGEGVTAARTASFIRGSDQLAE